MAKRRAEEIAARTVNKERARHGEARDVVAALARGHLVRPARRPPRARAAPRGRTKEQLYEEAKRHGVEGRSKMNKAQLSRAVSRKR